MRLKEMKRTGQAISRYVATLADDSGATDYDLTISGRRTLIEKAFAKTDFEVMISSKATGKDAEAKSLELWQKYVKTAVEPAPPEDLLSLRKGKIREISEERSVVVTLRRTRGQGTWWGLWFPTLFVPAGSNIFFTLSPVCNCFGALFPVSGDPDLFLSLNCATTPIVRASIRAGLAIDSVSFGPAICWPWNEFVPFFRVNGFLTSVTGFAFSGFGVFP